MKITAHTLVKNEQRWVWYALSSVLDYVDEILVWDTGSIDETVSVIGSISSPKIKFRQIEVKSPQEHTLARQHMLDQTDSDWILILDGDEIWWADTLKTCRGTIESHPDASALISPFINAVGDVFHFQPSKSSLYQIGPYRGSYNLRFINRRIPGLHVAKPHGGQEYRDAGEIPLQNFPADRLVPVDQPYFHTTHLLRSTTKAGDSATLKRGFKFRYELGRVFPSDFVYPEVFYLPRPPVVPDPFRARSPGFVAASLLFEPARWVKHTLFPVRTSGY